MSTKTSPIAAANCDADDNHRSICFNRAVMNLPSIDLSDADAIDQRFNTFLDLCDEWGMRPTVAPYALSLGLNRRTVYDIINQRQKSANGYELTPRCFDVIRKHYSFLNCSLETMLMLDKSNPVKYLFLMKNHFYYKDQTEHVNVRIEEKVSLPTPDEIAAKYAAQLGIATINSESVYELAAGA